jgi:hypothetical protein
VGLTGSDAREGGEESIVNAEIPASEPSEVEPTEVPVAPAKTVYPAEPALAASEPPPLVEPEAPLPIEQAAADQVAVNTASDAVVLESAAATESEPVVATSDAAAVETAEPVGPVEPVETIVAPVVPEHRVVYVDAPKPPRRKGNRIFGALIALAGAVVFAAAYAVALVIVEWLNNRPISFDFVSESAFWIPVIFFAIGFVILVLIVNRASWWAYIFGSLFVAAFVYFGSVTVLELIHGLPAFTLRPAVLVSPGAIIALFLAREVALWVGAGIAARGRRVRVRNVEARDAYDQEEEAKRAERGERDSYGMPIS